ncbi:MAG: RDD family protein [Actinomycetota bacterium]
MPTIGVGRRAVAILLDSLVFIVPAAPVVAHIFATTSHLYVYSRTLGRQTFVTRTSLGWENSALALLAIAWLAYMTVMESAYGASLGKFALGIRVVRLDGQPVDGFTSFLRNILRAVDAVGFYLVGAIIVWNSPLKQRLGDKAAKTIVVPASFAATYRGGGDLPPVPVADSFPIPPRPDR